MKTIETPLGNIDIVDGMKVKPEVTELRSSIKCRKCALYTHTTCYNVHCLPNERKDNNNIIYVLCD
jgi:hypothetical protein|nr:MAG TPA: PHD-finger [Crassvirales sp.]